MVRCPRPTKEGTLYELMGMDPMSSLEDLRRAARSMLNRSHPDLGGDASGFTDALAAWDAFKDDKSRERYDASVRSQDGYGAIGGASISFMKAPRATCVRRERMSFWKDQWEVVQDAAAEEWASKLASEMWSARFCVEFDVGVASSATRWWIDGGVAMASSSVEATESDASVCAMLLIAGFKSFGMRIVL